MWLKTENDCREILEGGIAEKARRDDLHLDAGGEHVHTESTEAAIHSHQDFIRKLCIILSYYSPQSSEWPIFMAPF